MLTLKVVTRTLDDTVITNLFYGERISHYEQRTNSNDQEFPNSIIVIGKGPSSSSKQPYIQNFVILFNGDNVVKQELMIFPYSTCYVMENGKTIDTFESYFISSPE